MSEELKKALGVLKFDMLVFLDDELINIKSFQDKKYNKDAIIKLAHFFDIYKVAVIRDEIGRFSNNNDFKKSQLDIFKKTDSYAIVPIYYQDELISILFLGKRDSHHAYNREDITFLEKISIGIGVPLQHAKVNYILNMYNNE